MHAPTARLLQGVSLFSIAIEGAARTGDSAILGVPNTETGFHLSRLELGRVLQLDNS